MWTPAREQHVGKVAEASKRRHKASLLAAKPTPVGMYLAIFLTLLPTWNSIREMRSFTTRNETPFGLQKEPNLPHRCRYPLCVSEDKLSLARTVYYSCNVLSTWQWSWGSSSQTRPTVRFTVVGSLAIDQCPRHPAPPTVWLLPFDMLAPYCEMRKENNLFSVWRC